MRRKVMKLGPATLVVSIPSKWAKEHKIIRGAEIELEEKDNDLIIKNAHASKYSKETKIDITPESRQDIEVLLTHIYRHGFDIIYIENVDVETGKKITNIVHELLLGFEVTSKEKNRWKIENIASPTEEKYQTMLRRIFLITKESISLLAEHLMEKRQLNDIEEFKKQHDKYILYCQRTITTEGRKSMALEWEMLTFLRHIEHSIYYLTKELDNIEKDSNILPLIRNLQEYFELYYKAYFSLDKGSIHKINKLKNQYQFGKCMDLINKGKNARAYVYIREIFRLIQIGTSPIFGLLLE